MLEAQFGSIAHYSHHANSSFGIPFDILGLHRNSFSIWEWLLLLLRAPFQAGKNLHTEKYYFVEADCDRPGEGNFLSNLLQPEVVIWLSSARTHSQQYDAVVSAGKFASVEEAVAFEYGWFVERCQKLLIINGDQPLMAKQLERGKAETISLTRSILQDYQLSQAGTTFRLANQTFQFTYLLPEVSFYALAASLKLAEYLDWQERLDPTKFRMPPGRSSLFKGVKGITILDSSYNANVSSVTAVLDLLKQLQGTKWGVIGDLIEQGQDEGKEHQKLVPLLIAAGFERLVLVGPRLHQYALPLLQQANLKVVSFDQPSVALEYLVSELKGGELVLFKGARYLEGVVEHLLLNPDQVDQLCRQEPIWKARRKNWGL